MRSLVFWPKTAREDAMRMTRTVSIGNWLRSGLAAAPLLAIVGGGGAVAQPGQEQPIVLARQGAFEAGGKTLRDDKGTLSCDHGHVEYQIPVKARATALVMWHSSSAKVWQMRW